MTRTCVICGDPIPAKENHAAKTCPKQACRLELLHRSRQRADKARTQRRRQARRGLLVIDPLCAEPYPITNDEYEQYKAAYAKMGLKVEPR